MQQNVLPSPPTEEVSINVFVPATNCLLYKNCKEDRTALKDSANADFGFSKTDKLLSVFLTPITPSKGRLVNLETSSVFCMELLIKNIKNIITNGPNRPIKMLANGG